MPLEGLGMPFCASRGFSSPSVRLGPAGGVGGVSGRVFGARELVSVSSVHLWTGDTGVALVRRTQLLFMSDWLFLLISVRLTR